MEVKSFLFAVLLICQRQNNLYANLNNEHVNERYWDKNKNKFRSIQYDEQAMKWIYLFAYDELFKIIIVEKKGKKFRRLKQNKSSYKSSYWYEAADESLLDVTFGSLIDSAAEQWKDDLAIVSSPENVRLTFREVKEKVDEIAAGLLEYGLQPGDTIAIWGYNCVSVYLLVLAAFRAGLILVGIEATENVSQIIHILRRVKAKALVVIGQADHKKYCEILYEVIPKISTQQTEQLGNEEYLKLKLVITSTPCKNAVTLNDIFQKSTPSGVEYINKFQSSIKPTDIFLMSSTSGSSGMPKYVLLTHSMAISSPFQFEKMVELHKNRPRIMTITFHIFGRCGFQRVVLPTFLFGYTSVLGIENSVEANVKVLQEERCSILVDTPTTFVDLIRYVNEYEMKLDYLENVISIGSPLMEKTAYDIQKVLHVQRIFVLYGMTEFGTIGYHCAESDVTNLSLLRIIKDIEAKIVDKDGRIVPMGQKGELWIRGNSMMEKYFDDDKKTNESKTSDGWLKTGDCCILEENGFVRLVGRIKDIILRNGENIYSKEIEKFLSKHPSIIEVHAFGVPDYRLGEELCVYIRRISEKNLTEEDVRRYCMGQLTEYEVPRYVRFVNEFPHVSNGKVNKRKLLKMIMNDEEYLQENKMNGS